LRFLQGEFRTIVHGPGKKKGRGKKGEIVDLDKRVPPWEKRHLDWDAGQEDQEKKKKKKRKKKKKNNQKKKKKKKKKKLAEGETSAQEEEKNGCSVP